jgi:hypothetical protein
MQGFDDFL